MDSIKLTRKQAKPILEKSFPEYNGRKIRLEFADRIRFTDTNWGDGTRNYYRMLRSDGHTGALSVPAPWKNTIEGAIVELPVDVLVVEHSIFCGVDTGITIYAHPSNAPLWLTA